MEYLILARRLEIVLINNKKEIYQLVEFVILEDHRVKMKESKKIKKYLDLAWG